MSRIFLTGDTHASNDIMKLIDFADNIGMKLNKEDKVIILGDFGFIWDWQGLNASEKYWLNWFNEQPWTTLFLDGNHENFDRLNQFEKINYCGGEASIINDSVIHLLRGQVYTFNDKTFLTVGGADSIDKEFRTETRTWWPQEAITDQDINLAIKNTLIYNNHVDYVLTHAGPTNFIDKLWIDKAVPYGKRYFCDCESKLQNLYNNIGFKKWFFGHYHCDYISSNFEVLYNQIRELN